MQTRSDDRNQRFSVFPLELEAIYDTAPIGLCVLDIQGRFIRINQFLADMNGLPIEAHLGKTVREVLPKLADFFEAQLEDIIRTGEPHLNVEVTGETPAQPGVTRHWKEAWLPIKDDVGEVTAINIVAEDVTEHKQAEDRNRLLQQFAVELAAAASTTEVSDVISRTVLQAVGRGGAFSGVFCLNETRTALERVGTAKLDPDQIHPYLSIPMDGTTPIADAVQSGQIIWIETQRSYIQRYPHLEADIKQMNAKSIVCLPFWGSKGIMGGMYVTFTKPKKISVDETNLLFMIAQSCGQALERALLNEKAQENAALQERQRLARELHDTVSQALFSATTVAETIPRIWEQETRALELLDQVIRLNRGAQAEMRTLLIELRPEAIIKTPLHDLLRQLAEAAQARKGINSELVVEGIEGLLAPELQMALYRITQESINNILKHSRATQFKVELSHQRSVLYLTITDNGQGFDTAQLSGGLGLANIRERAAAIGASLDITSTPGGGTRITLSWQKAKG